MEQKLSIIIPVYNVEKYLKKCLESIINQTYRNLEIIIINDGSTDSCAEICALYSKADSRIKVIHKQNGGLSSARNTGLDECTGDLIAFVDSDDWVDINMYSILVSLIDKYDCDISACGIREVYPHKAISKSISEVEIQYDYENAIKSIISNSNSIRFEVWNKVFRKRVIDSVRFKVNQVYEDVYFDRIVFSNANKIIYKDVPLYNYLKIREGNTSSCFNENRLQIFDELLNFNDEIIERKLFRLSQQFEQYILDTTISMFWDANYLKSSNNIKEYILRKFNNQYKIYARRHKIPVIKYEIFIYSPAFYITLVKIKNKVKKLYSK